MHSVTARYYGCIKYCDELIGRIVEKLKQKNLLDDTIIIVTADHGESMTEHGILFDHHGLYDPTTRVPLILRYPPIGKGVHEGLSMNLDITPTILDLLGIDKKFKERDGKSLAKQFNKEISRDFIFSEENYLQKKFSVRSKTHKLIYPQKGFEGCIRCGYAHGGEFELYDLEQDPDENKNIYDKNSAKAEELSKKGKDFFKKKSVIEGIRI